MTNEQRYISLVDLFESEGLTRVLQIKLLNRNITDPIEEQFQELVNSILKEWGKQVKVKTTYRNIRKNYECTITVVKEVIKHKSITSSASQVYTCYCGTSFSNLLYPPTYQFYEWLFDTLKSL